MGYSTEELALKLKYYKSLPEKARRHFLAVEYERLGVGSQRYLASVFKCARKTIRKGVSELSRSDAGALDYSWQRRKGGGRKKKKRSYLI